MYQLENLPFNTKQAGAGYLLYIWRAKYDGGVFVSLLALCDVHFSQFFSYRLSLFPHPLCPRNKKKKNFVSNGNKPLLNLFRLFFVMFRETKKHFFGLFRCFGRVSNQTEFCRNKPKKSPKKRSVLGGSSKPFIFFLGSNRNKPKIDLFGLFFDLLFCGRQKIFFRFVFMFRTGIETTETNWTYGMGNEKGWYFNKFAAVSVGLLFVLVVSKHLNSVSILKRNNRNKRLVSDSSETSFRGHPTCDWRGAILPKVRYSNKGIFTS